MIRCAPTSWSRLNALILIMLMLTSSLLISNPKTSLAAGSKPLVKIESCQIAPGGTAVIAITGQNIPSPGIAGYQINILYDPVKLEVQGLEKSSSDSFSMLIPKFDTAGLVKLAAVQATGVEGSITLAHLRIKAKDSAAGSTELKLTVSECVLENLKSLTVQTSNGQVDISEESGQNSQPDGQAPAQTVPIEVPLDVDELTASAPVMSRLEQDLDSNPNSNSEPDPTPAPVTRQPVSETCKTTRVSGNTAVQTAVQIAEQTGWTGTAILASSVSYGMVDALTAGPLAAYLKAPILLTEAGNRLNADTKAELIKLRVRTVYVTSGTGVISPGVLNELKSMNITIVPLGGEDRFATSVNIAQTMVSLGAKVNKVAIAYGWQNQDALSIASIASAQTQPILLTEKDVLPESVKGFLTANSSIKTSDIIGGTGVISEAVEAQLPKAKRHSGTTAYDTNAQVIKDFDEFLEYNCVYLANGETAIDALAGAPLAAQSKAPIVLTNQDTPKAASFIKSKLSAESVVTALGGTSVVPVKVLNGLTQP